MMSELSRINLVIPKDLWERVKRSVPEGKRSRLVVQALEAELQRRERLDKLENLRQFQEYMRSKYINITESAQDLEQMRAERDDNVAGLR